MAEKEQQVRTLKDGIPILARSIEDKASSEALDWLATFAKGLALLDDYGHEQLDRKGRTVRPTAYPDLTEYHVVVDAMKADFDSAVFGKEKDGSFQSAISQISEGFGDEDFIHLWKKRLRLYSILSSRIIVLSTATSVSPRHVSCHF